MRYTGVHQDMYHRKEQLQSCDMIELQKDRPDDIYLKGGWPSVVDNWVSARKDGNWLLLLSCLATGSRGCNFATYMLFTSQVNLHIVGVCADVVYINPVGWNMWYIICVIHVKPFVLKCEGIQRTYWNRTRMAKEVTFFYIIYVINKHSLQDFV